MSNTDLSRAGYFKGTEGLERSNLARLEKLASTLEPPLRPVKTLSGEEYYMLVGGVSGESGEPGELRCPTCGGDEITTELRGYLSGPDRNRATCPCGWEGIVEDCR